MKQKQGQEMTERGKKNIQCTLGDMLFMSHKWAFLFPELCLFEFLPEITAILNSDETTPVSTPGQAFGQ